MKQKEFLTYTILILIQHMQFFLDTKFKTKYICDKELSLQERRLGVDDVVKLIKEKHIAVEEVYELENTEKQIRFELFKVIRNNFTINKCENYGKLFIYVPFFNFFSNSNNSCSSFNSNNIIFFFSLFPHLAFFMCF